MRVLFVAHREEILTQARETYRQIRPDARLGFYTGTDKIPEADLVFASIQTLGQRDHLPRFASDTFDYIVVDEFHHAAAKTYRRLLDHFMPKFLLGLTATPERTDGGDLLGLCQENLVYRCDLAEGIRRALLCPFRYFGVPDDVDYRNIPWRSSRFEEEARNDRSSDGSESPEYPGTLPQVGRHAYFGLLLLAAPCRFHGQLFPRAGSAAVGVRSGPSSAATDRRPRATGGRKP